MFCLDILWEPTDNTYGLQILTYSDGKRQRIRSSIRSRLGASDFIKVYLWVYSFAPFELSVADFQRTIPVAYGIAVFCKWIEPAELKQKVLPVSWQFMLDAPSRANVWQHLGCSLFLIAFNSFVVFAIVDRGPLVFIGAFLVIALLMNKNLRNDLMYLRDLDEQNIL